VTDAVGANPALASLVLATANAEAATASTGAAGAPGGDTTAAGEAQQPGFNALLQGLQVAAAPTPGSVPATVNAATAAATAASATAAGADDHGLLGAVEPGTWDAVAAGFGSAAGAPLAAASELRGGRTGGDDVPDSGRDLPPVDDPAAAGLADTDPTLINPAPGLPMQPAVAAAPAPGVNAEAVATLATGTGLLQQATSRPGQPAAAAQATAALADDPAMPASGETDGTRPLTPQAQATTQATTQTGRLDLPADFRTHLDAALSRAEATAPTTHDLAGIAITAPGSTASHGLTTPALGSDALAPGQPALQPAGDHEAWSRGLGERLLLMADKGLQSATLRLQPEHLGPMEIRIHVDDDGAAQVLFSAHHGQTREALESAIPRLRELLAEQGLSLSQASVDAGRSGSFAGRGFAGRDMPTATPREATESATTPAGEAQRWVAVRTSSRRLDVMA